MSKNLGKLLFLALITVASSSQDVNIYITELFTLMVTPDLFNFTSVLSNGQFRYRPSILGRPNLPNFMNFHVSKDSNVGYLYGSADENYAGRVVKIEIVALNKKTYETRRIVIPINVIYKTPPKNKIAMKITNFNWENMNRGRVKNLKGVFNELWPESISDLSIIFMESAVKLGARVPLKPDHREGVIVNIGSNAELSSRLTELAEEIKPLSKLSTCTFKRTKVQQIFQNAGFSIDWCAFKIITPVEEASTVMQEMSSTERELTQPLNKIWNGIAKDELPDRNYSQEIAISVSIPAVLFAFVIALLTIVLCFHHEKLRDEEYIMYIQDLFEICTRCSHQNKQSSEQPKLKEPVQMVQYSGTNNTPPTTTLKSLHDPYSDNLSLDSDSPSTNIFQEGSPKLNAYYRPNPPAYNTTGKITFQGPSTSTVRFDKDI